MNGERGFTLIELVVAMALASILLALAIPSFRDSILDNQRASVSNRLITDLSFARAEAITRRADVVVCRSSDIDTCGEGSGWEDGWIVFVDDNGDDDIDADEEILRVQNAPVSAEQLAADEDRRLTIRGNNNADDEVVFQAITGRPAAGGTILTCDARGFASGRVLVIAASGRLRSFDTYPRGSDRMDPRMPEGVSSCLRS